YMNTIAMMHSLELPDIKVLNYLKHAGRYCSQKEISQMTGVPQTTILGSLQKLNLKGFVTLDIHGTGLAGMYVHNEELEKEFADAQNDMKKLCASGMNEQEVSAVVRGIAANLKEHLK
ncbi:MAG: winged helix-turn-helix domain-containing protein, partial [Solobacterium sp.]|nr:winged helix-turn-helix domain-containing protein [Solobacterium sp.]